MRFFLFFAGWAAAFNTGAVAFQENFESDPLARGWRIFGNAGLFHWNAANQNLEVTWDSSQSNSYLRFPLGTILDRRDDFTLALDLRLDDIAAGVNPSKPSTFALSFGFQNDVDAQRTNFFRGSGNNSPNLVEFSFFPDTGFGATVWPAVWSTNSVLNYNGTTDFNIFELPITVVMHITLAYTASNETAAISITTNGAPLGLATAARLDSKFTQFRLNTFAIESYSDAGQSSALPGSLLAHGIVDNVVITVPPPPIQSLRGFLNQGEWRVAFLSRTNWNYSLEATSNFLSWNQASALVAGNQAELFLSDTNVASPSPRYYRVRAQPAD